jgi:hypothetical protein
MCFWAHGDGTEILNSSEQDEESDLTFNPGQKLSRNNSVCLNTARYQYILFLWNTKFM